MMSRVKFYPLIVLGSISLTVPSIARAEPDFTAFMRTLQGSPSDLLRKLLANEACYSNETRFRGCVAALDELAYQTKKQRVMPAESLRLALRKRYTATMQVVERVGAFQIAILTTVPRELPPEEVITLDREVYLEWVTAVQHAYLTELTQRSVDFSGRARAYLSASVHPIEPTLRALYSYFAYSRQDPHSVTASSEARERWVSSSAQVTEIGSGAILFDEGNESRVMKVLPGGPAFLAGLREGDLLRKIAGKNAALVDLDGALQRASDHRVEVVFTRRSAPEISVSVVGTSVVFPHVFGEKMEWGENASTGYLRLTTFDERSVCDVLRSEMTRLKKRGVTSWILDLRQNGGGLSRQEACVEGLFLHFSRPTSQARALKNGKVTSQIVGVEYPLSPSIQVDTGKKISAGIFPVTEPLVILVDEGSASASEYVAASLRYHGRALVVGLRTYGKGSEMSHDPQLAEAYSTMVFGTSSVMSFPDGTSFHTRGVPPDFRMERGFEYPFQRENHLDSEAALIPPPLDPGLPDVNFIRFPAYAELAACVDRFDARRWYQTRLGGVHLPDLQLQAAKVVLECWKDVHYPVEGYQL